MSSPVEPADPAVALDEVLATTGEHVQRIVAAAEQRAEQRIRDAQRRLDAQAAALDAIADELRGVAETIQAQVEQLRSLARADDGPAEVADPAPAPVVAATPAPRDDPPPEDDPAPGPDPRPAAGPLPTTVPVRTGVPAHDHDLPLIDSSDTHGPAARRSELLEGARLVALSMAASGRSRGEVEAHLRDVLGITDYGPLIDYVFGISTPASVVPSWPPRRRRRD